MARSHKRYPIVRQERVDKKVWNRRLRRKKLQYAIRGSQYKKVMKNYDTWVYRWSLQDAIYEYKSKPWVRRKYTLDEWIELWKRSCYRK